MDDLEIIGYYDVARYDEPNDIFKLIAKHGWSIDHEKETVPFVPRDDIIIADMMDIKPIKIHFCKYCSVKNCTNTNWSGLDDPSLNDLKISHKDYPWIKFGWGFVHYIMYFTCFESYGTANDNYEDTLNNFYKVKTDMIKANRISKDAKLKFGQR